MTIAHETERSQGRAEAGARPLVPNDLAAPSLAVGEVFAGRYKLKERLGRGGVGVVFSAEDLSARGEHVAIKVLTRAHGAELARFKNEFRALSDVRHPHLVRLHQLASFQGTWFLVMDLVDGDDFLSFVRPGGALDEGRLRRAFVSLLGAVSALHAAGKLHGDLKPSNVLVTRDDGQVRVIDFGLTRDVLDEHASGEVSQFVGTPAYAAPEQAFHDSFGPSVDLYALGVMLYEALTGSVPFAGDHVSALVRKVGHDPEPPSRVASFVPPDLERLTLRLLGREPTLRPTAHDVLVELGAPDASRWSSSSTLLMGRDRELDLLDDALRASRAAPVLVYVHGASGIGKTSLLRRFGELARDEHRALVLDGRCYAREQLPFKAFDALVEQLSRRLLRMSDAERAALLPEDLPTLARVFPAFERIANQRRTPVPMLEDPRVLRDRAFRALKDVFTALAERGPVLLCFDDLQWGDADSASLLRELLSGPDAPHCLFVAAFRSEERSTSAMLTRLESTPLPHAPRELLLEPLTREHAEQLLFALVPEGASPASLVEAVDEARGSPFLLHELSRLLREGRVSALPELVAQGDDLRSEARILLEFVAMAGRPVPVPVALTASGAGVSALLELLASHLVRLRILDECECIEPYHDRLREAVTRAIPDERAPELLRTLALAHGKAHPAQVDVLVELYQRAGDLERAAHFAVRAAELAEAQLAFDRAADLYAFALAYGVPGDRAELELACATACARAGRVREAGARYERAASLVPRAEERRELQRRAMLYYLTGADLGPGERILRGLCGELGLRFPAAQLWLTVLFAWSLYFRYLIGPRLRSLPTPAPSSPDAVRSVDDERLELAFMAARGLGHHSFLQSSVFVASGLLLTRALRSPHQWATALAWEAQLESVGRGVSSEASDRAVGRALSFCAEQGAFEEHAFVLASAGARDVYIGRVRDAERAFDEAENLLSRHGLPVLAVCNFTRSGRLAVWHATGNLPRLFTHADRWLLEARAMGDPFGELVVHVMGSHRFLALDQVERAREALRVLDTPLGRRSQFGADPWWRADVELYDRRPVAALEVCRVARALPLQLALESTSLHRAWLAYTEARALLSAIAEGLPGLSRARVRSRLARVRRQAYPPARAMALHLEASLLALAGKRGEAERAFAQAAEAFEALDFALYASAMRLCQGRLRDDAEGKALVETAFARAQERGVRDPERYLGMLAGS